MRATTLVIAGCLVLLVAAFFASRSLTSEVTVPQTELGVAPAPLPPPPAPRVNITPEEKRAAMMPAPQGTLQPVAPSAPAPLPRAVDPGTQVPPAEIAESPFRGESKELEYVEKLLGDRGSDATKLKSAYEVLHRCLKQEPDNERCQDDMETAKLRLRSLGAEVTDAPGVVNPKLLTDPSKSLPKR